MTDSLRERVAAMIYDSDLALSNDEEVKDYCRILADKIIEEVQEFKEEPKFDYPKFATKLDAIEWMVEEYEDGTLDNIRFAYQDEPGDSESYRRYEQQVSYGRCSSFDCFVIVGGRLARIGCNYGH